MFLATPGIRAFPDLGPQGYENAINSAVCNAYTVACSCDVAFLFVLYVAHTVFMYR